MKTQDPDEVDIAIQAIRNGEPVILPFDTVYGLCSSPYTERPAHRLNELKGRPMEQPSTLAAYDLDTLRECLPELDERSVSIARALLPGLYTLIFPNPLRRYPWITGRASDQIGVRVPTLSGNAAKILKGVGAVMATSANNHRERDPVRVEDIPEAIRSACTAVIEDGERPGRLSTIIDFTGAEPRVLRDGGAPAAEALAAVADVIGA